MKRALLLAALALICTSIAHPGFPAECKALPDSLEKIAPAGATVEPALMVFDTRPNEAAAEAGLGICDAILNFRKGESIATLFTEPTTDFFQAAMDREARGRGAHLRVFHYNQGAYEMQTSRLLLQPQPGDHAVMGSGFGLIVTEVVPGSEADLRKVRPGDWIYSINGSIVGVGPVTSVGEVNKILIEARKSGQIVTVTFRACKPIQRDDKNGFVLSDKRDVVVSTTE